MGAFVRRDCHGKDNFDCASRGGENRDRAGPDQRGRRRDRDSASEICGFRNIASRV